MWINFVLCSVLVKDHSGPFFITVFCSITPNFDISFEILLKISAEALTQNRQLMQQQRQNITPDTRVLKRHAKAAA